EKRKEQRTSAIAKVLHRKIRAAVDPTTADIAVAVYDLDEIAVRLADGADYDDLTALIAADLAPARLASTTTAAAGEDPAVDLPIDEPAAQTSTDLLPPQISGGSSPDQQRTVDVKTGASPVPPAGTAPPLPAPPPPQLDSAPPVSVYKPTSDEDAAMYGTWRRGVARGQEPTGADLARAAGRSDDATGVGRRAARRYRNAHAKADDSSAHPAYPPSPEAPPGRPDRGPDDGDPTQWRHNGRHLNRTGAHR
ncbi:hypothetical protein AB0B76_46855, partial [Dactylosporangium sp. NPDC049140]